MDFVKSIIERIKLKLSFNRKNSPTQKIRSNIKTEDNSSGDIVSKDKVFNIINGGGANPLEVEKLKKKVKELECDLKNNHLKMRVLTQKEYDALPMKDKETIYFTTKESHDQ